MICLTNSRNVIQIIMAGAEILSQYKDRTKAWRDYWVWLGHVVQTGGGGIDGYWGEYAVGVYIKSAAHQYDPGVSLSSKL